MATVKRKPWMDDQVGMLKELAQQGKTATQIGRTMRRTAGAVRQKASSEGIPLQAGRTSTRAQTTRAKTATKMASKPPIRAATRRKAKAIAARRGANAR